MNVFFNLGLVKGNGFRPTSAAFTGVPLDGYGLYPVMWTHPGTTAFYAVRIPRIGVLP